MLNTTGNTLCIIASPFQCLCMLEALDYFKIKSYDVLIGYQDNLSITKIESLLDKRHIKYFKERTAHVLYDILPLRKKIKKRYTNFIIGDFENQEGFSLACLLAERNATICYIDDGAQAYRYFSVPPVRIKYKMTVSIVFKLYALVGKIKRIKKPIYFTIYDVKSNEYKIIKNELTLLKSANQNELAGAFIIGTNSSSLDFLGHSYYDYLYKLFDLIKNKYKIEPIYYCLHRRDLNKKAIIDFCKKNEIKVFDSEISVEYDFINKGLTPRLIIGFNSNALYTLHIIYPDAICQTVGFHLNNKEKDRRNLYLADKLQNNGIEIIDVFGDY